MSSWTARVRQSFSFVILLLLLVTAWNDAHSESHPKELRVAVVLGLTGAAAGHADGILKGIRLASSDLQARGWKLDLHVEDDQTDPAKTVSAFQFLFSKRYELFIGPTWSYQVSASRGLFSKPGVLSMVPGGSSDINGGPASGLFNLCPPRLEMSSIITEWLRSKKYRRAFIVTPQGDWGEIHHRVFLEAIKMAGIELVGDELIEYGIQPAVLRSVLLKAKQKGSDIIFSTASSAEIAKMITARDELKFPYTLLTSDIVREVIDGKLVPSQADILKDIYVIRLGASAEFSGRYREIYHEIPKPYAERGFDALMMLAHASEVTDGSAAAIHALLSNSFDYTGVSGRFRFNAAGDPIDGKYEILPAAAGM